jgi:hypothetical protein
MWQNLKNYACCHTVIYSRLGWAQRFVAAGRAVSNCVRCPLPVRTN